MPRCASASRRTVASGRRPGAPWRSRSISPRRSAGWRRASSPSSIASRCGSRTCSSDEIGCGDRRPRRARRPRSRRRTGGAAWRCPARWDGDRAGQCARALVPGRARTRQRDLGRGRGRRAARRSRAACFDWSVHERRTGAGHRGDPRARRRGGRRGAAPPRREDEAARLAGRARAPGGADRGYPAHRRAFARHAGRRRLRRRPRRCGRGRQRLSRRRSPRRWSPTTRPEAPP